MPRYSKYSNVDANADLYGLEFIYLSQGKSQNIEMNGRIRCVFI